MAALCDPCVISRWDFLLLPVGAAGEAADEGYPGNTHSAKRGDVSRLALDRVADRCISAKQLEYSNSFPGRIVPGRWKCFVSYIQGALMELSWIPYIFSALSLLLVLAAQIKDWRFGKPDALDKYEDVVNKLTLRIDKLEQDNERLEAESAANRKRIRELDEELEDYRLGVVILITQMETVNIVPKWKPRAKRNTGELKAK